MVVQVEPLFAEYSSLTFVMPEEVQVMFCTVPTVHFSPPFGAVTVTVGKIVNTALLRSFTAAFEASLILTRHCVDGVFGTVHV